MRYTILIGLLAAVALPAQAEIPLDAADITSYAQLVRDGNTTMLLPRQRLNEGDLIRTGDGRSSVTLYFVRDGVLTLGSNSQLLITGASPPELGRGDVLRLQLLRGELTLEAYPPNNTVPKDYRINVGPLQVRALGADMWAYANSEGEGVCLHQGAVEITGSAGEQRLDIVGDCLQHRPGRPIQVMSGAETEMKDRLLVAEQKPAAAIALTPAREESVANKADVKAVEVKAPVAAPTPHKTEADTTSHWVVVVATAKTRWEADAIAYKLAKRTLRTTVRETGKAPTPFSVTFGDFTTQKEANQFSEKLRRKYHLKVVRVAALS